jgi:hypothetical protein
VQCELCNERSAPLKLTNMLVKENYDVVVLCSQCVMGLKVDNKFKDAQPWPRRFFGEDEFDQRLEASILSIGVAIVVLGMLGTLAYFLILNGLTNV